MLGHKDAWVLAKLSDFWRVVKPRLQAFYIRPRGYRVVSIKSMRSYGFDNFSLYCGPLKLGTEEVAWLGFETKDALLGGLAHFMFLGPDARLSYHLDTLRLLCSADVMELERRLELSPLADETWLTEACSRGLG